MDEDTFDTVLEVLENEEYIVEDSTSSHSATVFVSLGDRGSIVSRIVMEKLLDARAVPIKIDNLDDQEADYKFYFSDVETHSKKTVVEREADVSAESVPSVPDSANVTATWDEYETEIDIRI